jgi:hypothetical protein
MIFGGLQSLPRKGRVMKIMFVICGGLGLLINIFNFMSMFGSASSGIGVGTSSFASAMALVWIGGMLFFGLGSLVFRREAPDSNLSALERWEGKAEPREQVSPVARAPGENPYRDGTPQAQE